MKTTVLEDKLFKMLKDNLADLWQDDLISEAGKSLRNSNPCWKGYHPVGMKKKGGKTVPNCVPSESVAEAGPNAPYTPSPAKPFRNPRGFNKQGTGVGNKLADLNRKEWEEKKKKAQGVAEGQLDEATARDVLISLLDKFYADMKLPPRQNSHTGLLNIKSPGTRVWTRGDGTRHRDPGGIEVNYFTDDKKASEKALVKFWPWLLKQPGVKSIGQISGEFGSSPMKDAVAYKGLYFTGGQYGVQFGSLSRIKNPRSVWRHQPPATPQPQDDQGVAEDWNKVNHHDKTNGLSQKAVNAYRHEHPGSHLQTAVTTKPSKLKAGSKAAKRRKSFCARMSGNKGPMKKPNGKPTPKALALRRWHCESLEELLVTARQHIYEAEGEPEGLKHLTPHLAKDILDQIETEGVHAIVKSIEWGDGGAKELVDIIKRELKKVAND